MHAQIIGRATRGIQSIIDIYRQCDQDGSSWVTFDSESLHVEPHMMHKAVPLQMILYQMADLLSCSSLSAWEIGARHPCWDRVHKTAWPM